MTHPAVQALIAVDDLRDRTRQLGPGVSSLGGCSRRLFHEIHLDAKCNEDTVRLPSVLGTIIHKALEQAHQPEGALTEVALTVEAIGLPGTADLIDAGVLTDYKTTSLKSLAWVKEHGPSRQQRWQVHTYAYAWNEGVPDDADYDDGTVYQNVRTVRLVFIPRDGTEDDVWTWEEPYDEQVAREAIAWYRTVEDMPDPPVPEKEKGFCAKYCPFFGELCPGLDRDDDTGEVQDDPWIESAAEQYARGLALEKEGEALKASAREALEGAQGAYGPWKVTQVHRASTETPDAAAMAVELADRDIPVPMKKKRGSDYPLVTRRAEP